MKEAVGSFPLPAVVLTWQQCEIPARLSAPGYQPRRSGMSEARQHHYTAKITWTGAADGPTHDYES